jgi:hypothetical protein
MVNMFGTDDFFNGTIVICDYGNVSGAQRGTVLMCIF